MGRPEEFDDHNNGNKEETDVIEERTVEPDLRDTDVNPYTDGSYNSNPYKDGPYNNDPYGSWQSQDGSHNDGPYHGNPYQQDPYGSWQSQGGSHNDGPYHGNPYQHDPYGNWQGQDQQDPCDSPYNNNPYSPYAAPAKKNNIALIIGIVVGIIILFLIAAFALTYKAVSLFAEERDRRRRDSYEEHEFRDDREKNREERREENDLDDYFDDSYDDYFNDDYFNDDYDDYGYDDYFNDDYDDYDYDNEQYYTLHDDIRQDLSYSVEFDYFEYESDDEDVAILVSYPVIEGENVPNLAHLNDVIQEEVDLFKDYYEEEYIEYMEDEDSYFTALSSGYVTYMDEEKLSIVFSEYIYSDYYDSAYLYCINIDMENGVILDNENILSIDDAFSVEFRKQSDIQNGEIVYVTGMTDQEITGLFNSPDVIVFYTPKGMEIGFNYEDGWVTVTYEEYEKYLKVF